MISQCQRGGAGTVILRYYKVVDQISQCHEGATRVPRECHESATRVPRECHESAR